MRPDDEMTALLKELGVELPAGGFDSTARESGSFAQIRKAWRELWTPALDEVEDALEIVREPYLGAVPVFISEDLVPDPLMFTLEFDTAPAPVVVDDVSARIAEIAKREATDEPGEDDHVSGWSPAIAVERDIGGPVAIQWHLDVASASPAKVRRVIEATSAYVATIRPLPVRLVVGDPV